MIALAADGYLTVQLLHYDCPVLGVERFTFLEMSTLQATRHIAPNKCIISIEITASTPNKEYLDEKSIASFKTISEFNDFFINNPDYDIDDCTIELENNMIIGSHDDGEVSVQIPLGSSDFYVIDHIFEKHGLDIKLVNLLKEKPGHYFAIDGSGKIKAEFVDFDDYLKNGRR